MIFPLKSTEFNKIHPFFQSPHLTLVADAMLAGNSPAQVWVDDPEQPSSALVWDRAHCFYLLGEGDNPGFNQGLKDLAATSLVPEITSRNLGLVKAYTEGESWNDQAGALFRGIPFRRGERVFFALGEQRLGNWRERIPEGCAVQRIDRALLTDPSLKNVNALIDEIESCWNSVDSFLEHGLGYCTTGSGEVMGWSTVEYVSPGKCGVGVETLEAYQRRGLATLAASAVVDHCVAQGLLPHWDCWKFNQPSMVVAEKVGFVQVSEYAIAYAWVSAEQVK